jgi:hypothetical protein
LTGFVVTGATAETSCVTTDVIGSVDETIGGFDDAVTGAVLTADDCAKVEDSSTAG